MCLFAVFPIHSETVAWICGRYDLLCTFFYLLAVFALLRWRGRSPWVSHGLIPACYLGAILSKEMAITLPVMLALVDAFYLRRINLRSLSSILGPGRYLLVLAGMTLVYFVVRLVRFDGMGGYGAEGIPPWKILAGPFEPLILLFYPVHLRLIHSHLLPAAAVILILTASTAAMFLGARQRGAGWNLKWAGLYGLVVAPLITITILSFNLQGTSLYYIPSALFCCWAALVWPAGRRWLGRLAVAYFLCLLALQWVHNRPWLRAGQAVTAILEQIEQLPAGQKIIYNIPDHFNGAYVFRNGLRAALRLRGHDGDVCWQTDSSWDKKTKGVCGPGAREYRWDGSRLLALQIPPPQRK